MPEQAAPLRVFGLWLLYAVAGVVIVIALLGAASMDVHEGRSPTRLRTKLVGAASGALLGAGALGLVLLRDPRALPRPALVLAVVGWSLGGLATLICWALIAGDLRRRGQIAPGRARP